MVVENLLIRKRVSLAIYCCKWTFVAQNLYVIAISEVLYLAILDCVLFEGGEVLLVGAVQADLFHVIGLLLMVIRILLDGIDVC